MRRSLLVLLAFSLQIGPARALAPQAALRDQPAAHGPEITIGDLFAGVDGQAARTVLARAAPPGQEAVLDAGAVQLVLRRAGYDWSNANGFRRIIVATAAGRPLTERLARPAARGGASRRPAALVWARNLPAGEIVTAADLVWSDEAAAPDDAVADPEAAIGKAARHALRAGSPSASRDLAAPIVVKRDAVVAVVFETAGVSLTLQAKALADAGVGDRLEVMNMQSKKVIQAVCVGPDQAVVGPRAEALRAEGPRLAAAFQ